MIIFIIFIIYKNYNIHYVRRHAFSNGCRGPKHSLKLSAIFGYFTVLYVMNLITFPMFATRHFNMAGLPTPRVSTAKHEIYDSGLFKAHGISRAITPAGLPRQPKPRNPGSVVLVLGCE
jgi:hypothetical protein